MAMRAQLYLIPAAALIVTAPAQAYDFMTLAQAQAQLFPGENLRKNFIKLTDNQIAAIMKFSGIGVYRRDVKAWRSKKGDWLILDQVIGRQDIITYVAVLDANGAVKTVEVLTCDAGYDGIRAEAWLAQFVGKNAATQATLSGVNIISGSTLSSVNLMEGIKRLIATHKFALASPAQ